MNEGTPSGPAAPGPDTASKPLGDVIAINEGLIKDHLNKVVVKTVEETLNAMLDAEADQLCGAKRYEHTPERVDTRAGHAIYSLHMASDKAERPPLAGLTSLRFFAACYVLLFHTRGGRWFHAGYTGVTLFFVLSGFILAYNYPVIPAGKRARFYIARFARIYPLYLFSWIIKLHYLLGVAKTWYIITGSFLYLFLLQTWVPAFRQVFSSGSWTMPVETFFYLVFPFGVAWVARRENHWRALVTVLWVVPVGLAIIGDLVIIPHFPASTPWVRGILSVPLLYLGQFLLGVTLGLRYLKTLPVFRGTTVLAATALCIVCLAGVGKISWDNSEIVWLGLMALPMGLLIFTIAGWRSRILANPVLQLGGEISYSIYLLQWELVDVVQRLFHHDRRWIPVRFALFLVAAFITYSLIEKPGRRLILHIFGVKSHPKPIETPETALP